MKRAFTVVAVVALGLASGVTIRLRRMNHRDTRDARAGIAQFRNAHVDVAEGDHLCRHSRLDVTRKGAVYIVTGARCPVCRANKAFDERVYEQFHASGVPVYWVMSNKSENDQAEAEFKAIGRQVIRENLWDFGVTRVPTMFKVNELNEVVSMWTG